MEDRDPVVALQACISAIRRAGGVGEEGASLVELERCLRRVGEALSEREREVEWLREALEQSKESYPYQTSCVAQETPAQPYLVDGVAGLEAREGGESIQLEQGTYGDKELDPKSSDAEPVSDGMTEPVYENTGMSEREGLLRDQSTAAEGPGGHLRTDEGDKNIASGSNGPENGSSGKNTAEDSSTVSETLTEDGLTVAVVDGDRGEGATADGGEEPATGQSVGEGVTESGTSADGSGGTGGEYGSAGSGGAGGGSGGGVEESEGYQKVEFASLYYHAATGYYYDATTQQFYAPVTSGYQGTGQSNPATGQDSTSTGQSSNPPGEDLTAESDKSTYQRGPTGPSAPQITSVADMLAAVSEHASQKCGLMYDQASGLYYDHQYAMYYDQESQLYYDADSGTYYEFDPETRQYQVHSHVKLPKKRPDPEAGVEKVTSLCSSSDSEHEGSVEEGELYFPTYPEGSPPPEEEWAPCLRLVVSSSECVSRGSVYVVTQEGAKIGREPGGPNPVTLREVQVSKSHVEIKYSQTNRCFTLCDLASQNGTLLNNQRITEPKVQSKPHPLNHNDILSIGSTSFTLHIHSGWDTCEWCRWEERGGRGGGGGEEGREGGKVPWKTELNRIKKRYGLRMKDTYGENPVRVEGYRDRAEGRRRTVGSDMPEGSYTATPASVNRSLPEDSVGHKMLQKLGWKKGEGLGKGSKGRTEPVKADVREKRSGLGSTGEGGGGGKRSLDAAGSESDAKHRRLMKHFSEVVAREAKRQ